MFQSLSGLSLGLNAKKHTSRNSNYRVSIPFRAVTGFERNGGIGCLNCSRFQSLSGLSLGLNTEWTPIRSLQVRFQSLSGLSLGLNVLWIIRPHRMAHVSIPFRAVTGFELSDSGEIHQLTQRFQSLSGLSLGLNLYASEPIGGKRRVSIPFRAVTGFEQRQLAAQESYGIVSIPFRAVTGFERNG